VEAGMKHLLAFSMLTAVILATPLRADDKENETPPKVYSDLLACKGISDEALRLACFDTASASFETAREKREVVMLDRTAIRKTKRSLFGFTLPKLPFFDGDDDDEKDEPLSEIVTTIESARDIGLGKWQFTLAEGGTWQSTEAFGGFLKEGLSIKIKRGIAGGYMMQIGKGPLTRVKRVN
jgi:hypothetical protein